MKPAWKKTLALFLELLVSVMLFGCAGGQEEKSPYPVTRVSVILPHDSDQYWDNIKAGIEEKEGEAKDYHIDINILKPQMNYSISQMTEILRKQIAAKADFIVVQGNEDAEFNEVLLEAQEEGIHIICMDTDIGDFPEHLYIGTDNYEAGYLLGTELAKLTGGSAKVAIISGEEQYLNMVERYQGLRDALEPYPDIDLGEVAYDYYDGLTVMQLFYEFSDSADTLVCLEGTGGSTIGSVYQGNKTEYRCIVGFDAAEGVKKGILDGIVRQDMNQIGNRVVEEVIRYVTEGAYSSDRIFTDIVWLTKENYGEVMQ